KSLRKAASRSAAAARLSVKNFASITPSGRRSSRKPACAWTEASLSRRDFKLVALDLGEVLALDPDELGVAFAPRRMQVAFVVEVRRARLELIGPNLFDLAGSSVLGLLQEPPLVHFSDAGDLPVNRPARPVIVRRAVFLAF